MANNILSHKGNNIGNSIKENDCEIIINEIFEIPKNYSCEIVFPEDVLVGKTIKDRSEAKELNNILDNDLILDIGPKTVNRIKKLLKLVRQSYGMAQLDILKPKFCKRKLRNCESYNKKSR